jgi:hypothetical protein
VVLDRLDMTLGGNVGVNLYRVPLSGNDAPIVIQNCTMRGGEDGDQGLRIEGRDRDDRDRPVPCAQVVVRENTLIGCGEGLFMSGAIRKVHVVGNRIINARPCAITLIDLMGGAADILVANNTVIGSYRAVRIVDDHSKGKEFLKCKNICVQNNLVLENGADTDMIFHNHRREVSPVNAISPCDLQALLSSPEWRFGHNWRGIDPQRAAQEPERRAIPIKWIPPSPTDHLQVPIEILSHTPDDPNYLRPAKDSPLATGGAGGSLPAYVGAVPPEGVRPWDWDKTWKALAAQATP